MSSSCETHKDVKKKKERGKVIKRLRQSKGFKTGVGRFKSRRRREVDRRRDILQF